MSSLDLQAARIVAGTLTLLSREVRQVGSPADLWTPGLYPEYIRELAASVGRGEALPLWVEERHPARGLLLYADSPEESEFFGWACARLNGPYLVVEDQRDREARVARLARLAIEQARSRGRKMMIVKAFHDPAVLRGFLAEGFVLAEIGSSWAAIVSADHENGGQAPPERLQGMELLEGEQLPPLAEAVVESLGDFFYDGHHRHDPIPGPQVASKLWSQVALADLKGAANPALALWDRRKDRAAAMATVRIGLGNEALLSIITVSRHYQGRGYGRLMMLEIINRLKGRAGRIRVETASYNLKAIKLYQGLGFYPIAPLAALHYHRH